MRVLEDEADAAFGGDDALPLAAFGDDLLAPLDGDDALPLAAFGDDLLALLDGDDALPLAPFEGDDADADFCCTPTVYLLLSDD